MVLKDVRRHRRHHHCFPRRYNHRHRLNLKARVMEQGPIAPVAAVDRKAEPVYVPVWKLMGYRLNVRWYYLLLLDGPDSYYLPGNYLYSQQKGRCG